MMRYADPGSCPDCREPIPAYSTTCPSCGLPLMGSVAGSLFRTLAEADALLDQLRSVRENPPALPAYPPGPEVSTDARPAPALPGLAHQPSPAGRGLSGASVPKILLSLGALCLLVAAITFLAVAWSWLGVGGRTAVLVGLTVAGGGLSLWLGRRGLRMAAESLSVVSFGLLTLDIAGADDAGWLGDLSGGQLLMVGGAIVGAVGLLVSFVTTRRGHGLIAPQVFTGLGLWSVPLGALDGTEHGSAVCAAGVVGFAGLAYATRRLSMGFLPWVAVVAAATWWLPLAGSGLDRAFRNPTWNGLWAQLHAWPVLLAAVLLLLPAFVLRRTSWQAAALAGLAAAMVTGLLALPALDHGTTDEAALTLTAFVVLWSAALLAAPDRWRLAATMPLAFSALAPATVGLDQAASVVRRVADVGLPWTRSASVSLGESDFPGHPALPTLIAAAGCLALVALVRWTGSPGEFARGHAVPLFAIVGVGVIGTLASYPVPLASLLGSLLVLLTIVLTWSLGLWGTHGSRVSRDLALAGALCLGALSLLASSSSSVLTCSVLVPLCLASALLARLGTSEPARQVGSALVPATVGALAWTVSELVSLDQLWRAVPVLLLMGGLALVRPRLAIELSAATVSLVASTVAITAAFERPGGDGPTSLALHLTLAGALVTASSLVHPARRLLAWPGGLLLAMATWVRLYDVGVTAPEAYTMPTAVALTLVGLSHLRRNPHAPTLTALAPGLVLATVPSLLRVLAEGPVSTRALLLGLGCLALVLAGTRLRWSAPLVVGALVGGVLVLRESGPYAADLPPWLLIALAGSLLTFVGITWEGRLKNLRDAGSYLTHLR